MLLHLKTDFSNARLKEYGKPELHRDPRLRVRRAVLVQEGGVRVGEELPPRVLVEDEDLAGALEGEVVPPLLRRVDDASGHVVEGEEPEVDGLPRRAEPVGPDAPGVHDGQRVVADPGRVEGLPDPQQGFQGSIGAVHLAHQVVRLCLGEDAPG